MKFQQNKIIWYHMENIKYQNSDSYRVQSENDVYYC
jgi:hypothetical protein